MSRGRGDRWSNEAKHAEDHQRLAQANAVNDEAAYQDVISRINEAARADVSQLIELAACARSQTISALKQLAALREVWPKR